MISDNETSASPFVGPRAYRIGESLFGREREMLELLDLLIAERIVLLYSPSGAGKTSLVQAALVPALKNEDFTVPPVARVTFEAARRMSEPVANRYIFSVLLSLEETTPIEQQLPIEDLARMSLPDYLDQRWTTASRTGGLALILDQFEEILTIDPTDTSEKREFFSQLGTALGGHGRWALLSMREEHIAALEPYRDLVPTRLASSFRLELLNDEQARQCMQMTSQLADVEFTGAAARRLSNDLRQVRVQMPGGHLEEREGPIIEPTVLQVVCLRLWSKLPSGKKKIEESDVEALGSADTALADYYAETMKLLGARERQVRDWIGEDLITQRGLRNQVLEEDTLHSRRLDASTMSLLVESHLVRKEPRRGFNWLELTHDRLIAPIRLNNAAWRAEHLTPFQNRATLWESEGRPIHLELRGEALAEAERWAAEHRDELTQPEQSLLQTSILARRRKNSRIILSVGMPILLIFGVVSFEAYRSWFEAQPWAFLSSLQDVQTYKLSGHSVSIGRNAEGALESDVSLQTRAVSRLHLFVSQQEREGQGVFRADDLRSLNGSTINARFLRYGQYQELENGDLIALAGVALFRFSEADPSYVPFLQAGPPQTPMQPKGVWGLLIDGVARRVIPLTSERYFLSAFADGSLEQSDRPNRSSMIQVEPDAERGFTLINKSASYNLFAMFKYEDRRYLSLQVPFGTDVRDKLEELKRDNKQDISGTEYFNKMTFCLGLPTHQEVAEIESDNEPACVVGPFQIVTASEPTQ